MSVIEKDILKYTGCLKNILVHQNFILLYFITFSDSLPKIELICYQIPFALQGVSQKYSSYLHISAPKRPGSLHELCEHVSYRQDVLVREVLVCLQVSFLCSSYFFIA